MEDIRSVEKFPSYFMGSIDLEDAYFSIPIHKSSRKYLRFKFLNKLYEFTCLPFGLNISPYIYTKLMKIPMNYL